MAESIESNVAVLNSQMDDVKKTVDTGFIQINRKIDGVTNEIGNITTSLTTLSTQYVTRQEFIEYKAGQGISKIVTSIMTIIVTAVITGLIYNALK